MSRQVKVPDPDVKRPRMKTSNLKVKSRAAGPRKHVKVELRKPPTHTRVATKDARTIQINLRGDFPDVGELDGQVTVEPHKIAYTANGRESFFSISDLKSAAYAVLARTQTEVPDQQLMSGSWPEIVLLDGTIVIDSHDGPAIGGTDVAVAQAVGSRLRVQVSNHGQPGEVQRFTFLSGTKAYAHLRGGGSPRMTSTVGQSIEVTFDSAGQPVLGTWH